MITIVDPKENIDKLWGKQQIHEDATYRLMRYVLRVDHDGNVLLHNVVTGRLVVLDQKEAETLDKLPMVYSSVMEQLVSEHYLVPEDFDEYQHVVSLRTIMRMLDKAHEPEGIIVRYTILPTTACNARCYYCFEQGTKPLTMSEHTADDVVRFIKLHCGGKNVLLSWFGGEPTLAAERIDQICQGLKESGVKYSSEITTNGYLFDEVLVKKAKELWRLKSAMICVDGTEESYNKTKCFVYENSNPYQIVMRNIGLLLTQNISVQMRMNFDIGNYALFADLINEAKERFQVHSKLSITAHPVIGEYKDYSGEVRHGTYSWFEDKILELNDIADRAGFQKRRDWLPSLSHIVCMAASDSAVTITPDGKLVSCPEQFGEEQWKGDLVKGIIKTNLVEEWKKDANFEKCRDCSSFPDCVAMLHCLAAGRCSRRKDIVHYQQRLMRQLYSNYLSTNSHESL